MQASKTPIFLQECENAEGITLLCWLPNKFSKVVWAQRGDYLIVAPSNEEEESGKVSATIVHILFPEQVDHLRALPCWPEGFKKEIVTKSEEEIEARLERSCRVDDKEGSEEGESDEDDGDLFVNSNRDADDSYDEEEEEDTDDEDA